MNELKTALETKAQNVINVTCNQCSELEKELNTIKEQLNTIKQQLSTINITNTSIDTITIKDTNLNETLNQLKKQNHSGNSLYTVKSNHLPAVIKILKRTALILTDVTYKLLHSSKEYCSNEHLSFYKEVYRKMNRDFKGLENLVGTFNPFPPLDELTNYSSIVNSSATTNTSFALYLFFYFLKLRYLLSGNQWFVLQSRNTQNLSTAESNLNPDNPVLLPIRTYSDDFNFSTSEENYGFTKYPESVISFIQTELLEYILNKIGTATEILDDYIDDLEEDEDDD